MTLLLADASPLIGFIQSGTHQILVDVIKQNHGHITVAHQVDIEICRNLNGRTPPSTYSWMKNSAFAVVLDEPTIEGAGADVISTASLMVDTLHQGDVTKTKNLGEALTIAHAVVNHKSNIPTPTTVLIDDAGGVRWADQFNIPHVDTIWVFAEAQRLGVLPNRSAVKTAYTAVGRHSSLPDFNRSGL